MNKWYFWIKIVTFFSLLCRKKMSTFRWKKIINSLNEKEKSNKHTDTIDKRYFLFEILLYYQLREEEEEEIKRINKFIFALSIDENTIAIRESIVLVDIILTVQTYLIDQLMLTKKITNRWRKKNKLFTYISFRICC